VNDLSARDLKTLADDMAKQLGSGISANVSCSATGSTVVVKVTEDLTARFDAVKLVRPAAAAVGGKGGGGRPDLAQGGGPDASKGQEALDAIRRVISGGG
jgi:alanyl-tRNA synthetase